MLTVTEALEAVIANAGRQPTENVELCSALGCALAQNVASDVDSPPFAKSLMDGFAVANADMIRGDAILDCVASIAAGEFANRRINQGETARIMTGAPLPTGADAVVVIERSQKHTGNMIRLNDPGFAANQNVMPRGREIERGEIVLQTGARLGPIELGILATAGCHQPTVFRMPTLAVISTGNELVDPSVVPLGPQIRNSNSSLVMGLATRAHARPFDLGIALDNEEDLRRRIAEGLQHDVLVLSGGVSAGMYDLVPKVLNQLGVEQVFHKVAFKPGKPIWFGRHDNGLVFGLPGNPVSTLACFSLFVRTAIEARSGVKNPIPTHLPARLGDAFEHHADRLTYHPATLDAQQLSRTVRLLPWFGSADLKALAQADCFVVLPAEARAFAAGDVVEILPFDSR